MTLKDAIFQGSSPVRHAVELLAMNSRKGNIPDAFVLAFTDGGPDHNISFLNVIISWLGYFILGRCDFLVVARTAPTQSWTNPAERVMSVLNLALSNCALSRETMSEEFEKKMKKCGSMSGVRKVAGDAEASSGLIEANGDVVPSTSNAPLDAAEPTSMEEPLSLVVPLASSVSNEGSASINILVPSEATLADDGRDSIEEASVDATEPSDMEEPLSLAIPLASSVPNEGSASINVLEPTEATLADNGRDPIEEVSVDAAEPSDMEEPLSLAIPLASSVSNEGTASINVLVPTKATPASNADESFDNFMEDVVYNNAEPTTSAASVDTAMEETHGAVNEVETNAALSFKDEYAKSIKPVMAKVDSLFARSMWSGVPIATHPPASDNDQEKLLAILRKISPSIGDHLQIDSSSIKKHPEIQKVLDNHSRGSAYFRQFFKRPLVAECGCVACREGMFSPIIMPAEAYKELHEKYAMPLPIPKPQVQATNTSTVVEKSDLHYMSFEEAVTKPFTDEHQPSLQKKRRNNNIVGEVAIGARESRSLESDQNKIIQGKFIRGLVSYKDCMKPRCLYYITAPNSMKPNLVDGAMEPINEAIQLCRGYAIEQF